MRKAEGGLNRGKGLHMRRKQLMEE